jgi:hypothetical protein
MEIKTRKAPRKFLVCFASDRRGCPLTALLLFLHMCAFFLISPALMHSCAWLSMMLVFQDCAECWLYIIVHRKRKCFINCTCQNPPFLTSWSSCVLSANSSPVGDEMAMSTDAPNSEVDLQLDLCSLRIIAMVKIVPTEVLHALCRLTRHCTLAHYHFLYSDAPNNYIDAEETVGSGGQGHGG